MEFSIVPKRVLGLFLIFSVFVSTSGFADNLLITRYFSGVWDQPEQESQGLILQIGEQLGDKKVGIAYWFTYGEDLQTRWFVAAGPVNGSEINMTLYTGFNIEFMADNLEGNANVLEVGTLDLTFKNCNHGRAYFDTPEDVIGSGDFPIKRINSIYRTRCSGGISDDTPSDSKPLQLEVGLHPAVEGDSGYGKARFWERADRSDFKVEVEDIPGGTYTLKVCEGDDERRIGGLQVTAGEGELVFRSPASDSSLLLDFDPRDCLIEVLDDGDVVVLTSGDAVLSEKTHGNPGHEKEEGTKLEADFYSMGVIEGAKGGAEFEIYADETEFSVKIKDVPAGFYTVWVGVENVGEIEVVEKNGKFEGKIKFSDPGFDPRGEMIQILQEDDQVILKLQFPSG